VRGVLEPDLNATQGRFVSYDIRVWTSEEPVLAEALPPKAGWKRQGSQWVASGRAWQVVTGATAAACDWEDIPEEADQLMPGLAWLVEINVEPISAPASARKIGLAAAKAISKAATGVVHDPQQDTWRSAAGTKRFDRRPRAKRFSILEMTWWFLDAPVLRLEGLRALLEHLEARFPEALPRRFGPTEPEQFKYAETGRDGLLDLWKQDPRNLFC
jgi:hypothetical protein